MTIRSVISNMLLPTQHLFKTIAILVFLQGTHIEYVEAQRTIDSLITLAESLDDGTQKAKQFLEIAYKYHKQDRDSAEYFLSKAWVLLEDHPEPSLVADAQTITVEIFRQEWSLDTLVQMVHNAMDYYQKKNDQEKILINLINLGVLYSDRSMFAEGIPYALEALDLAEKIGDTERQGKIAFNLGISYYNSSLFEEAVAKFRQAKALFDSIDHKVLAGIALSGIVNVNVDVDQLDSALMYAQHLLKLADSLKSSHLLLNAHSNLGVIHNNLGDYRQAIKYYSKAQSHAVKYGSKIDLANCWCSLGRAYAHLSILDSAAHYFEKSYDVYEGDNMALMHQFCSKEYADVLYRAGQVAKSAELLFQYVDYQDSVLAKENKEVIAGLEKKYQASRKDAEIAQQELTLEKRTSQRNLYLLGLMGAVGLIGFLVYRYRQSRKLQSEKIQNLEKYQRILAMDSVMQGQEEERKRIAQDLHDGLGTLLAAARMQMQSIQREVDKLGELKLVDKTEQLIDHACKEVRRISHDMMPSALVDLGFVAAIQDLVDDIKLQQQLLFKLNLPEEQIHLDNTTSLHLYRVTQEILQNIIKHANANIVELAIEVKSDIISLRISDDGLGFDPKKINAGLGLSSIRSRISYLKGSLAFDSKPGSGCSYNVTIPRKASTIDALA